MVSSTFIQKIGEQKEKRKEKIIWWRLVEDTQNQFLSTTCIHMGKHMHAYTTHTSKSFKKLVAGLERWLIN